MEPRERRQEGELGRRTNRQTSSATQWEDTQRHIMLVGFAQFERRTFLANDRMQFSLVSSHALSSIVLCLYFITYFVSVSHHRNSVSLSLSLSLVCLVSLVWRYMVDAELKIISIPLSCLFHSIGILLEADATWQPVDPSSEPSILIAAC